MVLTKALLFNPTFSCPSELHSLKPTSLIPSRPVLFCGSDSKVGVSKSTTEFVKRSAFRSGDGENIFRVFQREAFVKDFFEFCPGSMADELGATLNRLSKWVVSSMFAVVLIWRHDAASLWLAMGSVVNFILCVRLKRIFNQQRPLSTLKSDPGMPSSHAQSIFYISMVSVLSITHECEYDRSIANKVTSILLVLYGFAVIETFGANEITFIVAALALACGSYLVTIILPLYLFIFLYIQLASTGTRTIDFTALETTPKPPS
ncbi:hypothetical protein GH714_034115 [Hevea brasiliensis]|uniref:Phosphatidic acid phosphatase type 2/haloperoxidase domain-containing protein n=1 Tax=Hevea brasiliensis TaxID=3981 RepID=A0A6A6LPZ3_HEVBR|nr:hypothetical protein GH714_034115 [Hevea brasiliensis]